MVEDKVKKIGWPGSCRAVEPVEGLGFPLVSGGKHLNRGVI